MKNLKNMRNLKFLTAALIVSSLFIGCSKDDDPQPVNEEEVITTMTVTLQPEGGGTDVILEFRDLDGDGSNEPEITNGNLTAGVTYSGSIVLLNEAEEPAENITEEVEEENLEHQFFFTIGGGLDVTISDENLDDENNIFGTTFKLTAGTVSSGELTFTLVHEPTKPNNGLESAGGETDISVTFDVSVE
jgi:hypothetical protein